MSSLRRTSLRLPFGQYSVTMATFGTSTQPPMNLHRLGWSSSLKERKTEFFLSGRWWDPLRSDGSPWRYLTCLTSSLIVLDKEKAFVWIFFIATVLPSLQKRRKPSLSFPVVVDRRTDRWPGHVLNSSAGKECFPGYRLSSVGTEGRYTAGVTVTVGHDHTHDAAHGQTSHMVCGKKKKALMLAQRNIQTSRDTCSGDGDAGYGLSGPLVFVDVGLCQGGQLVSNHWSAVHRCWRDRTKENILYFLFPLFCSLGNLSWIFTLFYCPKVNDPTLVPQQLLLLVPQPLQGQNRAVRSYLQIYDREFCCIASFPLCCFSPQQSVWSKNKAKWAAERWIAWWTGSWGIRHSQRGRWNKARSRHRRHRHKLRWEKTKQLEMSCNRFPLEAKCKCQSRDVESDSLTAGRTVLLASRATCIRPTRMWAIREVKPAWIKTTCETEHVMFGNLCPQELNAVQHSGQEVERRSQLGSKEFLVNVGKTVEYI